MEGVEAPCEKLLHMDTGSSHGKQPRERGTEEIGLVASWTSGCIYSVKLGIGESGLR